MDAAVRPRQDHRTGDVPTRVRRALVGVTWRRLPACQKRSRRRHQSGGAGATQESAAVEPIPQLLQSPARSVSQYAAFASTVSRLHDSGKYSALAQFSVRLP